MKFVSFFAGIGGIDLGLERAGHECVGQIEIDPYATKVLEKHWPLVWRHDDITTLEPEAIPQARLWAGGFPCQDISNAGRREGITGSRSGLFIDWMYLASVVRPELILLENVAALLHRGMGEVLGVLSSIGYDAEWEIISAEAVGAPHLRERVFILAHAKSQSIGAGSCSCRQGRKRGRRSCNCGCEVPDTAVERSQDRRGASVVDTRKKKQEPERQSSTRRGTQDVPHTESGGLTKLRRSSRKIGQPDRCGEDVPNTTSTGTGLEGGGAGRGSRQERQPAGTSESEILRQENGPVSSEGSGASCSDVSDADLERERSSGKDDTGSGREVQEERVKRELCRGDGSEDVSDTLEQGLEGHPGDEQDRCEPRWVYTNKDGSTREKSLRRFRGDRGKAQWQFEPDVGGTIDGFSSWLDGFDLTIQSQELLLAYGNAQKERPREILRTLRDSIEPQKVQRGSGVSLCISSQEVLFTYLCKLQTQTTDKARLQLSGEKASEGSVRGVSPNNEPSGSSHRPDYIKQHPVKYPNTLQNLSRLLAFHSEKAWAAYRRSDACPVCHWEAGIDRVANKIPSRVDRLKGLGNAVVPQVAEFLGTLLKD